MHAIKIFEINLGIYKLQEFELHIKLLNILIDALCLQFTETCSSWQNLIFLKQYSQALNIP